MAAASNKRKDYFFHGAALAAFDRALTSHVASQIRQQVSQFIPPENTQRLRHGEEWAHPGLPDVVNGGIQQHSSEMIVKFDELVAHDIKLIDRHVAKMTSDMQGQFMRMMYTTVGAACDQTGNVVDAQGAGPIEGLAAMLEKIQFFADKHGNVKFPEIHLSPESLEKFQEARKSASPELLRRIEETQARKVAEAIQDEGRRKARFVRYGGHS